MSFLLLSLLALPSVLGDCTFTTNDPIDIWTLRQYDRPEYAFLRTDQPVRQVSNYTTCNQEFVANALPGTVDNRTEFGGPPICKILAEGGVTATARFSVKPMNSSGEALEDFFNIVYKAVDANKKNPGYQDAVTNYGTPRYELCGSIKSEYENAGILSVGGWINLGDSGWASYEPLYMCVDGKVNGCTNGLFENGTELTVCGVGRVTDGNIVTNSNRTIRFNGQTYEAKDQNPALNSGLTCETSMGSVGFEVKTWLFGVVGLAMIVGQLL